MRGERWKTRAILPRNFGSSPHARGTPPNELSVTGLPRFIPACAGNAPGQRRRVGPCRGSSPHARGTQSAAAVVHDALRFIPACAGNAPAKNESISRWPVHPRMRGERLVPIVSRSTQDGSSPHARGTLKTSRCPPGRCRFIPACAGNASADATGCRSASVHPRMRGER